MAKPEVWNETCLVSLYDGTTIMDIAPIMTSVTINQGGKPVESTPNLNGGRLLIFKPEEDTEIEFEGMAVGIGNTTNTSPDGLDLFFHGITDSAAPYEATSSLTRIPMETTIMWTDDTTTARGEVTAGKYGYRYNFANSYITVCQPSFTTDGGLVNKYTLKCAPRDKTGTSNITVQSTDGTSSIPAL